MVPGPPRRRRARPVADAPIDALLAHTEDLAKGWLLALLEQAPLDEAPAILGGDLPRDGPRICEAVLRALADDTDLRRLEPGGALTPLASRVGELVAAGTPEAASGAVDALQAVIWAGLRDELRSPEPALVSELAERLALVSEQLRVAALRRVAEGDGPRRETSPMHLAPPPASDPEAGASGSEPDPEGTERREPSSVPGGTEAREGSSVSEAAEERQPRPRPQATEERPPQPRLEERQAQPRPEAAGGTSQALWIGALEEEIQRATGSPLSLVLAELEDADRVVAVESAAEAGVTFGEFAQAVRSAVRRQDILVCESDTRAWIIARDTGRTGAQALASRIDQALRERRPWRGAALSAGVGVAVLGEDGASSAELMDAAEEARFAATAAGIGVIRAVPDNGQSDQEQDEDQD
jgi:GGDEF domain-containing protein